MKIISKAPLLLFILFCNHSFFSQEKKDSLGLPGDNFDLYGALELFKQSKNPEEFEKAINSGDNEINNLDLNADGKVDYVKVIDKPSGNSHALVLQDEVSKSETQDVAVIEIEKGGDDNARVQIVGDEELYGKNYIVEPKNAGSGSGNRAVISKDEVPTDDVYSGADDGNANRPASHANNNDHANSPVVVNVWSWPSVQYMYGPSYVGWVSPYYWGYYPVWWQPWQPVYYPFYYRRVYRYHRPYFHRTVYYRCADIHNYYYGRRMASETVRQRNSAGFYHERNAGMKTDPVRGRRYNNLPANADRQLNRRERAAENREGGIKSGKSAQPSRQATHHREERPRARENAMQRQSQQMERERSARPQTQPGSGRERSGGSTRGSQGSPRR